MNKLVLTMAMVAGLRVFADTPALSFSGDTVTVSVPAGFVTEDSKLTLCWGPADAGAVIGEWEHSLVVTDNGVTAAGGNFQISASDNAIAEGAVLQAFVTRKVPFKVVEYVDSSENSLYAQIKSNQKFNTVSVDTGIRARAGLHVKTKMRWLAFDDTEFCGGRKVAGDSTRICMVHVYNNKWFLGYGGTTANTAACTLNTDYEVETKLSAGTQTLDVDGSRVYTLSNAATVDAECNCLLFACNYKTYSGNPAGLPARVRCYYLKLWEGATAEADGTLVRDFIPVKDAAGHGALYDTLSGNVYTSTWYGAETYLGCGEETGNTVVANNLIEDASSPESILYDPNGTLKVPPEGFTLVANSLGSYAFSCVSLRSYEEQDISATLTVGAMTVDGTIDWENHTIVFPTIQVDADAEALVRIIYDSERNLAFTSCFPLIEPAATAWIGGVPGGEVTGGSWQNTTFTPNSKADAALRVIDFTCTFNNTTDSGETVPEGTKFGIEVRQTSDGDRFYVIAGGAWQAIAGDVIVPDCEKAYAVKVLLDAANETVAYYVKGPDGFSAKLGVFANAASKEPVERIVLDGAGGISAFAGARRGLAENYAFNMSGNNHRITIYVDPDIVTGDEALILCWDAKDKGDQATNWTHSAVIANPATDGRHQFDARVNGLPDRCSVRAFLVGRLQLPEYIGANGAGFIDTTVPAKSGMRAVTRMMWKNLTGTSDVCYLGARRKAAENSRMMAIHAYPGQWGIGYETGNWNNGVIENNVIYDVESKMYVGEQKLVVDGVTKYTGTNSKSFDYSPLDYSLFAIHYEVWLNASDQYHACKSAARCYYLKMYENGNKDTNPDGDLVRDFIPAKLGGTGGIYDLKNKEFIAGEGTFVYGTVTNGIPWAAETKAVAESVRLKSGLIIIFK